MISEGMIVKVNAGHDAGRFCLVMRVEGKNIAYISDGKTRTIEKPKKKNQKHLNKTNHIVDLSKIKENRELRRILWPYNYGEKMDFEEDLTS